MGGTLGDAEGEVRVGGAGAHHRIVSAQSPSAAAGARVEDALYPGKHFDEREEVDVSHVPSRQWIAWKLRSLFFCHYLALSFYYPFVVLWMRKTGLSNASIGAINSMRGIAVLFIPLWGAVSDKYNAKMVLLIIVCIATLLRCSTTMFSSFESLLLIMVLSDTFGQPIEPSIDSMALRILEDPNQYGAYRMYGTISWGLVGGPLAGYILRSSGVESLFVVHGIVMLCTATVVCLIPNARPRPQLQALPDSADADCGGGVAQVVGSVCKSPSIIFCFMATVLISGAMALINSYSFLVAQDMGDTGVVIGLVPLFSALGEIPSFLLSDRILQKIGLFRGMQLSLATVTIRLGAYIFMTEPYQILWVEWLHGPMFGLMWAAGTQLCRQLSPLGMESSMQAFLSCLVFGLGSLAGNTFGGFMSEIYSLPFLIGFYALCALVVSASVVAAELLGLVKFEKLSCGHSKPGERDGKRGEHAYEMMSQGPESI